MRRVLQLRRGMRCWRRKRTEDQRATAVIEMILYGPAMDLRRERELRHVSSCFACWAAAAWEAEQIRVELKEAAQKAVVQKQVEHEQELRSLLAGGRKWAQALIG